MYHVENNHPPIISKEKFNRTQEELSRRNAIAPKSTKNVLTATGKYSKYALTEVLICGECGSRYKRVTWSRNGRKKIVWRYISRLDYGTKYCSKSLTVDEAALHKAIVRALNRFNEENKETYISLMKATIGEAIGLNYNSDEINYLERRVETLNNRMLSLVSESVQNGEGIENHEDEFKAMSDEVEQLKCRIDAIRERESKDDSYEQRLKIIQDTIGQREMNRDTYDDTIVRQMVECIKVFGDNHIKIILGGGYEIEENLQ